VHVFVHPRNKDRPFHFGSFPLETLRRDVRVVEAEAKRPARAGTDMQPSKSPYKD